MANITNELNNIKNAVYGKEVRGSIHDGIDKINKETEITTERQQQLDGQFNQLIINSGNSNAEVVAARVEVNGTSYETLGKRLDNFDSQLEENKKQNYDYIKNIMNNRCYNGAVAVLVDDDGTVAFNTVIKPLLDSRNIKCSLGVVTDMIGTNTDNIPRLTKEQLLTLQDDGFEIVSHSKTHARDIWQTNVASNLANIEQEMILSQKYLMDNGFLGYDTLIYPWGNFGGQTTNVKNLARKYYNYAINSSGGLNSTPVDNMYILRFQPIKSMDYDKQIKTVLDDCIANKKVLVMLTHANDSLNTDTTQLAKIFDYLIANNVPILPFRQAMQLKGNVINIGDSISVSADGKTKGLMNYKVISHIAPDNGFNQNSPLSVFDDWTTTVYFIRNGSNDSITGEGGTIEVHKGTQGSNMNFEIYISSATTRIFKRRWNDSTLTWGSWEQLDNQYVIVPGMYTDTSGNTMDDPATKFKDKRVSIVRIRNGSADTLTGEGGTMEIHNVELGSGMNFAIFNSLDNGRTFKKLWIDSTSSWGAWKEFSFK